MCAVQATSVVKAYTLRHYLATVRSYLTLSGISFPLGPVVPLSSFASWTYLAQEPGGRGDVPSAPEMRSTTIPPASAWEFEEEEEGTSEFPARRSRDTFGGSFEGRLTDFGGKGGPPNGPRYTIVRRRWGALAQTGSMYLEVYSE